MASEWPEKMTYGEKYDPAMKVQTQEEAAAYFERCVTHTMRFGKTRQEAESIERSNIGYFAGYYDSKTAARVYRLYGFGHPIFGTTQPTPDEAFEAGKRMAIESKESGDGQ